MLQGKTIQEDIKNHWKNGGIITRIILMNIGVFLLINVGLLLDSLILKSNLFYSIFKWLFLPTKFLSSLIKPWTYITYAFCHIQPFHLLFNMMGLYFFGKLIKEYIGEAKILPLFLYGSICGGVLFQITSIFVNPENTSTLIGASAGVMALVVAAATLIPDYTVFLLFFGAVRLKWIAISYVLISILSLRGENFGGNIAHIGGALLGYVFIVYLNKGKDFSKPFYGLIDWIYKIKDKPRMKAHTNQQTSTKHTKQTDVQPQNQEKLDAILEKIHKSGYESLSKEDKEFLFLASKDV